jgi:hypothetical protein
VVAVSFALALDEKDLCAIDGAYAARPSGGHF